MTHLRAIKAATSLEDSSLLEANLTERQLSLHVAPQRGWVSWMDSMVSSNSSRAQLLLRTVQHHATDAAIVYDAACPACRLV
jgi:hypothetical protein